MTTRIIVCGGRHYADRKFVFDTLDWIWECNRGAVLVHGGATGADTLAAEWAKLRRDVARLLAKENPNG